MDNKHDSGPKLFFGWSKLHLTFVIFNDQWSIILIDPQWFLFYFFLLVFLLIFVCFLEIFYWFFYLILFLLVNLSNYLLRALLSFANLFCSCLLTFAIIYSELYLALRTCWRVTKISTEFLFRPTFSSPNLFNRYSLFLLGAVNLGFEAGSTSDVQVITTTTHSGWYYFMSSLTLPSVSSSLWIAGLWWDN